MNVVLYSTFWLLNRSRSGLIALLTGVALFEFIQPVAIASFRDLQMMQAIASYVPPAFLAMFNMPEGFLQQANLSGFLSLGFSHPVYHLLSSATVIWFVTRNLTGEIESGSIQVSLSRPVARWQVYLARVAGVAVVAMLVSVVGSLGMIIGIFAGRPDGTVDYANFPVLAFAAFMLLLGIGGVALAIAATADRAGQAVGWSIAFLVISFVIDYFAQLWNTLEPLDPLSVFNYFEPVRALSQGSMEPANAIVLITVSLIGATIGNVVFGRRDLP
ncbi:MAG: ABC transporter permease subunit [Thermomicrobiales bacterium]